MAEERIYSIPLRKEARKGPRYMKANKSIRAVREFLQKHMKCDNVKLGRYLNMKILEHGRKNTPHHVEVKVVKEKDKVKDNEIDVVRAYLVGAPEEEMKPKKELTKKEKKIQEKELSKVIKEKEKEKEKAEKTPKPKRGKLADKASEDVASGVMETRVTKSETQKHMKPKK